MLKPQTTPDLIALALRGEITDGRLGPGDALRQEELATRFAVSRIPVREALRRLESEGLVAVFPNRGAFVVRLSAAELGEITDLRVLVEGDLLARAVPAMTAADLERLVAAAGAAERAAATPGWAAADRAFHAALYAPAGRPRWLALALSLRGEVERYEAAYARLPERRREWLADHARLMAACREGDAATARSVLEDHIARAGAFLVGHLAGADG